MSLQVQVQKALSQVNFLESTVYDKYDLTNLVKQNERFIVRQGDLIASSYWIENYRKRGLRAIHLYGKGKVQRILDSHVIVSLENETVLLHPEHGVVIIPKPVNELGFYTFIEGGD